jgi:DNA-binding NarL/FixJ family response regulator
MANHFTPPHQFIPLKSSRNQKILGCLERGLRYKEIEDRLSLSTAKLRRRVCSLYTKLAAHSRVEAMQAAASFLQANARQRQLERLIAAQQAECQIR